MTTKALPEGSLLLHIGPPKTGSTAIQMALHTSRPTLAEHGVLYPGTHVRERPASWAVLGSRPALGREAPRIERWHALVEEIRCSNLPRVCLSHENFARADDAAVDRILDGTGRERTHVIYVARRLDKVLPSHWQERVKAWETASYEEYLHRMLDNPSSKSAIWQAHGVADVVHKWASRLGNEQVTIVVSDEDDRGLLPRTMEAMLGLPEGLLVPPTGRTNASLSLTEAEALRRLNRMAQEQEWTAREYWLIVQAGVLRALRDRDRSGDARIGGLPQWAYDRVIDRAERQIADVVSAGVKVIGDPEHLRVADRAQPAEVPEDVKTVPLDLLADMVRGTIEGARAMHRRELRATQRRTSSTVLARRSRLRSNFDRLARFRFKSR